MELAQKLQNGGTETIVVDGTEIVLNSESEIGCSVSFDTPRKLINENKEIEYKNLKDEEIKLEVLSFYSRKNRDKLN